MYRLIDKITQEKYSKVFDTLFWLSVIIFSLIYSFMSVRIHNSFETYGWDLGVFDHGIWQWSQFKIPFSSFHDLPWLADHFHLTLLLLVPFYWIYQNVRTLIVLQAVITCLGAVPVYLLSKKVSKNNLFSLVISLGFLVFYSLQWHTFSGFHELALLPITLGFTLYFWETKNSKLYWIFFILALFVKEETGLLLGTFGLWSILTDRKRWKQGLTSILLGWGVAVVLIGFVMPWIAGGAYRHAGFGSAGNSFFDVIEKIIRNPLFLFKAFIDSPVKIKTMFTTFWPWAFLPIFAPSTLLLSLEQFATRFVDYEKVIRWTPFFAYSLPMATIMAWGSIYGFRNLMSRIRKNIKIFLGVAIPVAFLALIIGEQILLHAPINSLFKQAFYRKEKWMDNNLKVLKCVPPRVSVSAQNNLAPWLSERERIKVFPEGLTNGYEYIVADLHSGQSENSFFYIGRENTKKIIGDLLSQKIYKIVCQEGDAIVLRKASGDINRLKYDFPLDIYEK